MFTTLNQYLITMKTIDRVRGVHKPTIKDNQVIRNKNIHDKMEIAKVLCLSFLLRASFFPYMYCFLGLRSKTKGGMNDFKTVTVKFSETPGFYVHIFTYVSFYFYSNAPKYLF